jgi:hypothetical protein
MGMDKGIYSVDKKKFNKEMEKQRRAVNKRYPGVKRNTDAIHNFARRLTKKK